MLVMLFFGHLELRNQWWLQVTASTWKKKIMRRFWWFFFLRKWQVHNGCFGLDFTPLGHATSKFISLLVVFVWAEILCVTIKSPKLQNWPSLKMFETRMCLWPTDQSEKFCHCYQLLLHCNNIYKAGYCPYGLKCWQVLEVAKLLLHLTFSNNLSINHFASIQD